MHLHMVAALRLLIAAGLGGIGLLQRPARCQGGCVCGASQAIRLCTSNSDVVFTTMLVDETAKTIVKGYRKLP